jgi:saccharopine dehydrogenase (NADP+, L-glutamate forming)
MKQVLILGAGLVAGPMVRYLLDQPELSVKVASRTVSKAEALVGGHPKGQTEAVDVRDDAALSALIQQADLVVSLLPYTYHLKVAHQCLEYKKHLVTTSYIKPEMNALDSSARRDGLIFLNEIGLDPGIDHMSAKRVIDEVHAQGGKLTTFVSYCGGLPAPDANDNPMGYKFSWSPRGVVMAGKNPAHYLWDGKEISVAGEKLFSKRWPVEIEGVGSFIGYPNRDSMPYTEVYGIQPTQTMFRGTLRYPGWCSTMEKIAEMGFLDDAERDDLAGKSFAQCTAGVIGSSVGNLKDALKTKFGIEKDSTVMTNIEWLGLLCDEALPAGANTLMDVLADRMLELMPYKPGERDMIVLYDVFYASYPDRAERTTSTLVDYGIPFGDSAMARTVSMPAAIAVNLILKEQIKTPGVHAPVIPEIYNPVLDELETFGIKCIEETSLVRN